MRPRDWAFDNILPQLEECDVRKALYQEGEADVGSVLDSIV